MIAAMRRLLTTVLLLAALPRAARAQRPVELSGGYSLAHDPRDEVTLPAGWIAGAAVALTPALSAVADVSGQYQTIALVDAEARLTLLAVMGGVRASARIGPLTEFVQILAGSVRATGSAFGATTSGRSAAIQPGGGVDYPLARAWAVRAEVDLRLLRSQPDATNGGRQARFAAALVYRTQVR
jgi:hypothetical protein